MNKNNDIPQLSQPRTAKVLSVTKPAVEAMTSEDKLAYNAQVGALAAIANAQGGGNVIIHALEKPKASPEQEADRAATLAVARASASSDAELATAAAIARAKEIPSRGFASREDARRAAAATKPGQNNSR